MQNITSLVKKNPHLFLLICFYGLTVLFRLWFMAHHFSFGQDVARDVQYMKTLASLHTIIVGYGPKASVGNFYLPPFYYQLHYIFSVLTNHNPVTMFVLTVLIESLTPIFLFFILKRFIELKFALALAVLYSLFSVAITASTSAWNPHMIPFLSTLALWSWLQVMEEKKYNYIIIGTLAVTLALHLHYQSAVLLPFVLIIFFWSLIKDRSCLRYWLLAIGLSLLTFVPYILAEIQDNWQNTKSIVNFFTHVHAQYYDRVSKPDFILNFIPSFMERVMMGKELSYLLIGRLIFFIGFILMGIQAIYKKNIRLLFIYFISILIMLRIYKGDKNDFYMSVLYIMPAVLLAIMQTKLKYIVLGFAIIISFYSGHNFATIKPFNDLTKLKDMVTLLNRSIPTSEARFIFHDTHHINLFIYGISQYGHFTINQSSPILVDLCNWDQICTWNNEESCRINRSYSYSQYLKLAGQYENISVLQLYPYQASVGILHNQNNLPPIHTRFDYGTDILIPELQINP